MTKYIYSPSDPGYNIIVKKITKIDPDIKINLEDPFVAEKNGVKIDFAGMLHLGDNDILGSELDVFGSLDVPNLPDSQKTEYEIRLAILKSEIKRRRLKSYIDEIEEGNGEASIDRVIKLANEAHSGERKG